MFRSLLCKSGAAAIIRGESSSSSSLPAKYFLFTASQNQNVVVISKSRIVTSLFYSFSTSSDSDSDTSFVVSYLINSCGLTQDRAISASKKIKFKTTSNPDSVLTLLRAHGFTELQISKIIPSFPAILLYNPHKTLKPKLEFFESKGLYGLDLANFISGDPLILSRSLSEALIPSFDILKSIVQSDQNVIKMIKRNARIITTVKRVMVNLELLRNEGVPESKISRYIIDKPRAYTGDADSFKEIVEKVKDMGFNRLQGTFLRAIQGLTSMSEVNWRKKEDVYKTWGWSEDHIQTAFRKNPQCMTVSEKKIMAVMNFLVNEMGYESLSIAERPTVICCSMKERIIPRCSVIRILVSRGLIKEKIAISTISKMLDKSFLEKYVIKYEQEVPELMKVFQGQLNYQQLLQN
ncbi:uncharacterized protein LOC113308634 [Papaver somniferum]|uniref:uncharacterized protein LOC113308634 n=1 Tax=Papaver somniferum TaxID=3469 RepID=UPI000E6FC044|nr:uncharacterized protein LOC113308634 [Papaver somniferum]XP_026412884.1 uncharacterized protein LOC113308634 [Papaver somniferum]